MESSWKMVETRQLQSNEKAVMENSQIIIYRRVEEKVRKERDITSECTAELVRSMNTDGHYCAIKYEGITIFALGIDYKSKAIPAHHHGKHLRLSPARNATVSFHIIKER